MKTFSFTVELNRADIVDALSLHNNDIEKSEKIVKNMTDDDIQALTGRLKKMYIEYDFQDAICASIL